MLLAAFLITLASAGAEPALASKAFYAHVPHLAETAVATGVPAKEMMMERCRAAKGANVFECVDVYESGAFGHVVGPSGPRDLEVVRAALGGADLGREVFQDIQGGKVHSQLAMPDAPKALPGITYIAGRDLLQSASGPGAAQDGVGTLGSEALVEDVNHAPYHLSFLNERARRANGKAAEGSSWDPPADTYRYARTGTGVTAYVLGEGVNVDHVEFMGGRAVTGLNLFPNETSPCAKWQGTHVASMISGVVHGVAKGAQVVSVAVTPGCRREMPLRNMVRGLQWVLDDRKTERGSRPALLYTVPRLNVRTSDPATVAVVEGLANALLDANVTILSSVGAGAKPACDFTPQRLNAVIAPAALDLFRTPDAAFAARPWQQTNFGECIDLWAPGSLIEGAFSPEVDGTAVYSGTAQAGAIAAGVAAMILESEPGATPDRVKSVMLDAGMSGASSVLMYSRPNTTTTMLQVPLFI